MSIDEKGILDAANMALEAYSKEQGYLGLEKKTQVQELLRGVLLLCKEHDVNPTEKAYQPVTENDLLTANHVSLDVEGVTIDETLIDNDVFNTDLVNWRLLDLDDFISELSIWLGEAQSAGRPDASSMLDDLTMLNTWEDDYVWSSTETNDFVSPSLHKKRFNEICEEVLETNAKLSSSQE